MNTGVARIFQRGGGGPKRGSEATERAPSHGREIFETSCMKTALLEGRLCEVAYTNPLLPHFKFLLLQSTGGGGHGRLCPLAMPVTVVQPRAAKICQRGGGAKRGGVRKGTCTNSRYRCMHSRNFNRNINVDEFEFPRINYKETAC